MESVLLMTTVGGDVRLGARWLYRRRNDVNSYYEREYEGPPITDLTSWFGGDRH